MMRAFLLALLTIIAPAIGSAQQSTFLTTAPQPDYYAWWLRTEYHPFGTDVRGIPVAKIRAAWCKANEFRKDLFPADLAAYFEGNEHPFAIDGFFDGSKTKQTALVGVYETCKGERGAFFLVLAWPPQRATPTIRFIIEIPGEREFAVLSVSDKSTITVQHCLECDHTTEFRWSKSKRRFVQLAPRTTE